MNTTAPEDPAAPSAPATLGRESLNLPNTITFIRLLLSVVLFCVIDVGGWWITAAVLFVLAAGTDWLDGYLARRLNQITTLGRIMDPFVDKIIIGGAFVFLMAKNGTVSGDTVYDSGVSAWMVIIIIGREMFVSSLRGFLEQQGKDFSASFSGKAKMFLQCIAVTACLLSMDAELGCSWMKLTRDILLWLTVAVTVWSGMVYVVRGVKLLRQSQV